MVYVQPIHEIRPRLADDFSPGVFSPRTAAIAEAYRWGQEMHSGQLRLSGEPYFETHCGWVAAFLDRLLGIEAWTIAALLHDSVEDSGSSLDAIRQRFPGGLGEEVAYIVDGVTKISAPRNGRSREIETLRKLAMFRDPGVFVVKLADKSHNLLTLQHMPEPKRMQKAVEAIRAYGRLAGILNCYRWRRWIEDMAFPFADPDAYAFVKNKIDSDPRLGTDFINGMQQQLAQVMEREKIDGRIEITVNGYWQAWEKIKRMAHRRKTSLDSFAALNDLISFRLVLDQEDPRACYALLGAVNRFFGSYLDHNGFHDYIACPQNGYRALQMTAWLPKAGAIEVAIATRDMEGENTWGVVYAIQHGKDTSTYRPVQIFTPSGGTRFVPEGSTVLDAVATIQQEFLLDKISAVKVNDGLARLSDRVNSGDMIEVVTGGSRLMPVEEWLSFCNITTSGLLRAVLANSDLKRDAELGRQQLRTVLAARGLLALEDMEALDGDRIDTLLGLLGRTNLEDLYAAIGGGAVRLLDVARALDQVCITKQSLHWTSIEMVAPVETNRPGVLALLASLVSERGGNILRSVNDTLPDGGFSLRLVVSMLDAESQERLYQDYLSCNVELKWVELV